MLQEVLEYVRNRFVRSYHEGTYTILDGSLPLDFMKDGQRIWITGSDLNDGIYTYHDGGLITNDDDKEEAGLRDETFAGCVCALAVPPAVIALTEEIKTWVEKNSKAVNSPFQSESFNGYSYSLKSGSGQGDGAGQIGWQNIFANRLNRWRKM